MSTKLNFNNDFDGFSEIHNAIKNKYEFISFENMKKILIKYMVMMEI